MDIRYSAPLAIEYASDNNVTIEEMGTELDYIHLLIECTKRC